MFSYNVGLQDRFYKVMLHCWDRFLNHWLAKFFRQIGWVSVILCIRWKYFGHTKTYSKKTFFEMLNGRWSWNLINVLPIGQHPKGKSEESAKDEKELITNAFRLKRKIRVHNFQNHNSKNYQNPYRHFVVITLSTQKNYY